MTLAQLRNTAGIIFACCVVVGAPLMLAKAGHSNKRSTVATTYYVVIYANSSSKLTAHPKATPPKQGKKVSMGDTIVIANETDAKVYVCESGTDPTSNPPILGAAQNPIAAGLAGTYNVNGSAKSGQHSLAIESGPCTMAPRRKHHRPFANPIIIINR